MTTIKVPYLCEGICLFYSYFSESDVAKDGRYNTNNWTAACKHEILTYRKNRRVCVCVCVSSPIVMSHNAQYTCYRNSSRVSACPIARPNPLLCSRILFYFAAFFFPSCSILLKLSTALGNVICSYLLTWMLIDFLIPGRVRLYKLTNSAMLKLYREFSRTRLRFR
jgi:hypothetical protein